MRRMQSLLLLCVNVKYSWQFIQGYSKASLLAASQLVWEDLEINLMLHHCYSVPW